jgi:two-component system cell cycle response regulator
MPKRVLDWQKKTLPDLILMDIQLPGMDGLQATKTIRKMPELKDIKIVALTSYAMEGDSLKAMAAGCDGYLTKPIDTRKFIQNITPFLPAVPNTKGLDKGKKTTPEPKILIVDDELMNLKLLRAKLSKDYTQIIEASDGQEALEKVTARLPDLILLDIMMPNIDGFEVTRQLKSDSKTKDIPIILITALDGHDYKIMGYEAGADDFLNKPINTLELLTRVKSLLNMKQCQDRLASETTADEDSRETSNATAYLKFPDKKIYTIIDDPEQCNTIKMYLFAESYDMKFYDNAKAATTEIQNEPPDILITDSQIQVEELKALRRRSSPTDSKRCNTQFLYLTTKEELESNFALIEEFVDDFLTQPFNIYELRARVRVLLKKKSILDRLFHLPATNIQVVITDPLTGLYTFEYCNHVLKHELQRAIREGRKVSLVMMEINDQVVSHATPANAITKEFYFEIGDIITKSIRKLDIASRRSEREFVFVLPEADNEKAKGFIQRLQNVLKYKLSTVASLAPTENDLFCFGHAVCPDESDQLDELIALSEASLKKNRPPIQKTKPVCT